VESHGTEALFERRLGKTVLNHENSLWLNTNYYEIVKESDNGREHHGGTTKESDREV